MHRATRALRLVVTVIAIVIGVEAGYRLYLYLKHPNYFTTTQIDEAEFSVLDQSIWQYDRDYGHRYVPSQRSASTTIKAGVVIKCEEQAFVNEQGNLGPPAPDFDAAEVRIAVFGDSFSGAEVVGPAWTKMLGENLESELGKTVRVLNLARDGYGVPQMVALAAGRLEEIKPSLAIFAFAGTAFNRAKAWRTLVGPGDDVRFYTSTENSPNPNPEAAADSMLIMPSMTRHWCKEQLTKSADEQKSDPILQKILTRHREFKIRNGSPHADLFDLTASYVYGLLRYRSPFKAQWRKLKPATNPELPYDDYRDDPGVMTDLAVVMKSGVPYLFVHLAGGTAISEGHEFNLDVRGRKLMESLQRILGREIHRTSDFVSLSPDEARRMCNSPGDCHPTEFGKKVYAQAVARMVVKGGFQRSPNADAAR